MSHYVLGKAHYSADSPEELVKQMHKRSFSPEENDQAFMEKTSDRVNLFFEIEIRHDTASNFIEDLINYGVLRIEQ